MVAQNVNPYFLPGVIDLTQPSLWLAVGSILFNPIFWNVAARQEYHNKVLTKLAGGNPRLGCYGLAATIFALGIFRDHLYNDALTYQPAHPLLTAPLVKGLSLAFLAIGNTFVISSMWALGVTGTYLGDYFGILMDHRVTGFPFNVLDDPMYVGSTLNFAGVALWFGKPAGLILTVLVYTVYRIALLYEGPFTDTIYSNKNKADAAASTGKAAKKDL